MRRTFLSVFIFFFISTPLLVSAQDTLFRRLPLEELFRLAIDSNVQIRVSKQAVEVARARTGLTRTLRNPALSASASAYYLGDATIFEPDFSKKQTVSLPHFGNTLTVQASEVIYKGGAISGNIAISGLQEKLTGENFRRSVMDVKIVLAANYFDLYRLYNQREVYRQNIHLAELRIRNISRMHELGMVTRNDVIRNELLVTNFRTSLQQVNNSIDNLSQQLDISLGLPDETYILPDTAMVGEAPQSITLREALEKASSEHPELRTARINTEIAGKGVDLAKADRSPTVSLTAANSLARPVTSSSPARDLYTNGWQAGVAISYNISSLFNAGKNIRLANTQLRQQQDTEELQLRAVESAVRSAFIRYREAIQLLGNAEKSLQLALENYRIVDKKYQNRMASITEVLDAGNARLESELQQKNAQTNIHYTWYLLQRAIGTL